MEEPKKGRGGLIATIVILTLLLIGACTFIVYDKFVADHSNPTKEVKEDSVVTEDEEKQVVETAISIDDPKIRHAMAPFHNSSIDFGSMPDLFGYFYSKDKITINDIPNSTIVKLAIADYYTDDYTGISTPTEGALSILDVKVNVQKAFGTNIKYTDESVDVLCSRFVLNPANNVYDVQLGGCGGVGIPNYKYKVVKATETDETLTIYEKVGYVEAYSKSDGSLGSKIYTNADKTNPVGDYEGEIDQFLDKLDSYKWTFKKEGSNYIFKSVEKVA